MVRMNTKLLGPLSLWKHAWQTYKAHWKILTLIALVPSLFMYVGMGIALLGGPIAVILGGILSLCGAVLFVAMPIAMIGAIRRFDGSAGAASLKGEYAFGFSLFWPALLLIIIQIFVHIGSGIFLMIPAVIMAVYGSFSLYGLVLEGKKGIPAIIHSFSIVSGRWWKTLGRIAFLALPYLVVSLIAAGLAFVISAICGLTAHSSGYEVVRALTSAIANVFFGPVAAVYMYKLYISLKETVHPDAPTVPFRRWLIAFLTVGALIVVAIPIAALTIK